jgi:hypothetical protein
MLWLTRHKRSWRAASLVLLVVALTGPWFFDRIHVPSPYTCSPPNVRLDENFCGTPLPLTWIVVDIARTSVVSRALAGAMEAAELLYLLPILLLTMLLVMPLVSTSMLIVRKEHRRWHRFQLTALVLAACVAGLVLALTGLAVGLSGLGRGYWVLWGHWLYIIAIASMLLGETRLSQDQ